MNITQIMLAKNFGGAERLFVDFSIALAESGENVQAICQKDSAAARLLEDKPGIDLSTVRVLGSWDVLAKRKIKNLLKRHSSQVVQAHLARGALLAGRACDELGLPLVVTTHNYIDLKYYRYVSMLVPPTRDQLEHYISQGFPEQKMTLIRHFSPFAADRARRKEKDGELRLISVGRLVEKKGFHVLLKAFAGLAEGDRKLFLEIGGTGPEEQRLRNMIEELGLQNRVVLSGWIDDVEGFLQGGDVFVLPSLDEPFGIVALEAMAAGMPIVSSKSKGPSEVLDEETAWLCEVDNEQSMKEALQQALSSSNERARKGNRAREVFKRDYSKETIIPLFRSLYASL